MLFKLQVTGVSPNTSTNPSPISSSILNGEGHNEPVTQSQGSVPVIKVNGMWKWIWHDFFFLKFCIVLKFKFCDIIIMLLLNAGFHPWNWTVFQSEMFHHLHGRGCTTQYGGREADGGSLPPPCIIITYFGTKSIVLKHSLFFSFTMLDGRVSVVTFS